MKQKVTHSQVVNLYKQLKHQIKVGIALGISRQRVKQILDLSSDPDIITIRKIYFGGHKKYHTGEYCIECKRLFTKKMPYQAKGLCTSCYLYFKYRPTRKKNHIRTLLYPKNCIDCKKKFKKGDIRSRGMCNTCRARFYRSQ